MYIIPVALLASAITQHSFITLEGITNLTPHPTNYYNNYYYSHNSI